MQMDDNIFGPVTYHDEEATFFLLARSRQLVYLIILYQIIHGRT